MENVIRTAADYKILSARPSHAGILTWLGRETFIATFGYVFDDRTRNDYLERVYDRRKIENDLRDANNHFLLIRSPDAGYFGYAKLLRKTDHGITGELPIQLDKIYLLDAYHGRGAGQALLEACVEQTRAWGGDRLWLEAWQENYKAHAFYRRNRFYRHSVTQWRIGGTDYDLDVLVREV
jgi:GNAT superfamily N-acetyltransferase